MRVLILTQGQHTVIADSVYEWASKFKWYAKKDRNTFYAARNIRLPDGRRVTSLLHREILKAPKGVEVDHQDGDGLNNLPDNIRICSSTENARNRSIRPDTISGYKGVYFHKATGKWQAEIQIAGKRVHLGLFEQKIDAAKSYDRASLRLFGEFARPNFPLEVKCA